MPTWSFVAAAVVIMSVPLLLFISPSAVLLRAYPPAVSEVIVVFPEVMFHVEPNAKVTSLNELAAAVPLSVPLTPPPMVTSPAHVSA